MFAEAMLVSLDFVTNSENTVQRKGSWLISAGSAGHGSCIQVLRGTRTSSRHAFRGATQEFCVLLHVVFYEDGPMHPGLRAALAAGGRAGRL